MQTLNLKSLSTFLLLIVILCLTGCKKSEKSLSLNATETTLTKNQTFNLIVSPDTSGCVYESENDFIATVSPSGVITAQLTGETYIDVSNADKGFAAKCKVTVSPVYSMYREPYLVFGKSKTDVKAYETRLLLEEDDSTLFYSGENSYITDLLYLFEKSAYTVSSSLIPASQVNLLVNYLTERYVPVADYGSSGPVYYMTTDRKTIVDMTMYSDTYWMIIYMPYPTSKEMNSLQYNPELIKTTDIIKNQLKAIYFRE
ncbi:MAG: hypothetical protein ABSG89_07320 [Bacteroidales bacterium]|jgi:hypothetical protein